MIVIGVQPLTSPFVGNGELIINGQSTGSLRWMPVDELVSLINSFSGDIVASLTSEGCLELSSDKSFTLTGNQDVLDVIGLKTVI